MYLTREKLSFEVESWWFAAGGPAQLQKDNHVWGTGKQLFILCPVQRKVWILSMESSEQLLTLGSSSRISARACTLRPRHYSLTECAKIQSNLRNGKHDPMACPEGTFVILENSF